MVIETYTPPTIRNRYYDCGANPFNMDLVDELKAPLSGEKMEQLVDREYRSLPHGGWPTFVVCTGLQTFTAANTFSYLR